MADGARLWLDGWLKRFSNNEPWAQLEDELLVVAALCDEIAAELKNLGVVQIGAWSVVNHWLARYDALKAGEPEPADSRGRG